MTIQTGTSLKGNSNYSKLSFMKGTILFITKFALVNEGNFRISEFNLGEKISLMIYLIRLYFVHLSERKKVYIYIYIVLTN